jgi:hypothetical protein
MIFRRRAVFIADIRELGGTVNVGQVRNHADPSEPAVDTPEPAERLSQPA